MKKFILLITLLFLTTACSNGSFKQINLKNLENKINDKESFVLFLTDLNDGGNTLSKTIRKTVKDNDIDIFYINTSKLKDDDLTKLKEFFTFEDTNIIIFVKKGIENTVLSRIDDQYISQEKLEKELKIQGYLK